MNILIATFYHFAAGYGCGTYGQGTFDNSCSTAANNSQLTNTGFAVAVVLTAACILIFITLLIRFWRKKK